MEDYLSFRTGFAKDSTEFSIFMNSRINMAQMKAAGRMDAHNSPFAMLMNRYNETRATEYGDLNFGRDMDAIFDWYVPEANRIGSPLDKFAASGRDKDMIQMWELSKQRAFDTRYRGGPAPSQVWTGGGPLTTYKGGLSTDYWEIFDE
jgi:hypothetical protein